MRIRYDINEKIKMCDDKKRASAQGFVLLFKLHQIKAMIKCEVVQSVEFFSFYLYVLTRVLTATRC